MPSQPRIPAGNGTPILDDLFATLFAPATPPASPAPFASSSSIFSLSASNPRPRGGSITAVSPADSDFGAFVSVPASEHPLAQLSLGEASPSRPLTGHPLSVSTGFFAEARAATARNQQGFLAELLEHEDDPMYWHEHTSPSPSLSASSVPLDATTPQPPQPQPQPTPDSVVDLLGAVLEPVQTVAETALVNPLLDALNEATSDDSFAPPLPRKRSTSVIPRRSAPPSPIARSPSLPPSPSQPIPPILTRIESTSTFSSASLPSKWMSSFLTYRGPSPSASPSARLGPARVDITHGSPFAASPFVPASGAPGFDGDRAWNKGFDLDASNGAGSPEQRGVQLLGRKESTRVVLGNSLADAVRPVTFLPLKGADDSQC
ncbi:hypothetical protein BJV74DRAFT_190831 [Russula compacta]|nr:hypothetical protein BJV74DRAFT_190831 [Russula compacta]